MVARTSSGSGQKSVASLAASGRFSGTEIKNAVATIAVPSDGCRKYTTMLPERIEIAVRAVRVAAPSNRIPGMGCGARPHTDRAEHPHDAGEHRPVRPQQPQRHEQQHDRHQRALDDPRRGVAQDRPEVGDVECTTLTLTIIGARRHPLESIRS